MIWGYTRSSDGRPPNPLNFPVSSHPSALLTGSSGSGKSMSLLYLTGSLLKSNPEITVFFLDFKNSEDFSFLSGYPYYYSGDSCYEGVISYYDRFCKARKAGKNRQRHLMIFDEYPAFIHYLSTLDKRDKTKKSGDVLGIIAEILMLGRGIQYGVWIVTQRADASLFANGARDNFMISLGLGRMSREQRGMLFTGEELPDRIYRPGEGILLADGHELKEVVFPRIRNPVDWKWHIKEILMANCIRTEVRPAP